MRQLALGTTLLMVLLAWPVHALTIAADGQAFTPIVLATDPAPAEQTAAEELAHYLGLVAGAEFAVQSEADPLPRGPAIFVGPTTRAREAGIDVAALGPEEWIVRTAGDDLLIVGGRPRGTLYAATRFLEDVIGVHWWSPWAESVPSMPTIEVADLDLRGQPVIRYRDIYMLYGNDGGAFAARNRLNRQGDALIEGRWGGGLNYGPPYHVHTFYLTIKPDEYFATHPEYFSLINGQRTADRAQLCLTNPDLRALYLEKLVGFIEDSSAAAEERGEPAPLVFSVSQNDWGGACQCENCQAIALREGSEAGPLLDFVNYLAEAIAEDYPDVYLDTLAYTYTQAPPKTIRPRDNVIVRLCDTTSNFTRAITDPENQQFHGFLLSWAEIAPNLRIWDYAVTYAQPRGLPLASVHTYGPDFRFYAEHNVEGVFTELEYPVIADMRDLKVWMMIKLLEDPYADYDALLTTFTDGFYGAAGPMVREYLAALQASSEARISHLKWDAALSGYRYLTLDFVRAAQATFDRAEAAVADDAELLQRVRHARMPLDRATVMLFRALSAEWAAQGNDPATLPLDRDAIAARYEQAWLAEVDRRLTGGAADQSRAELQSELVRYTSLPAFVPRPAKFADLPASRVFDFTADTARNWRDIVELVEDEEAESGITGRLEFPTTIDTDRHPLEKYVLPMPWGLYDQANRKGMGSAQIRPEDVPGPGYHWYRLGEYAIGPSYYLYFFWSWIIQVDLGAAYDDANPDRTFEIWARIKFEGPAFPHGAEGDANAISVERVVLVAAE